MKITFYSVPVRDVYTVRETVGFNTNIYKNTKYDLNRRMKHELNRKMITKDSLVHVLESLVLFLILLPIMYIIYTFLEWLLFFNSNGYWYFAKNFWTIIIHLIMFSPIVFIVLKPGLVDKSMVELVRTDRGIKDAPVSDSSDWEKGGGFQIILEKNWNSFQSSLKNGVSYELKRKESFFRQTSGTQFRQEKRCTICNNIVANSSKVGDKCPHCGVYWSDEKRIS